MSKHFIPLPLTNVLADGGYSASVCLGSQLAKVNLIIDTGSSTLVVHENRYQGMHDTRLQSTSLAQQVSYGVGGWFGSVVHTRFNILDVSVDDMPLALVHHEAEHSFINADGIWGMAYHSLNRSYDMSEYLTANAIAPPATYPWPFPENDQPQFPLPEFQSEASDFKQLIHGLPEQDVATAFTLMEQQGLVSNRFAFIAHRSSIHHAKANMTPEALALDPQNQGMLILGGDERLSQYFQGEFTDLKVVHDRYYNVNLLSLSLAGGAPIKLPSALEAQLNRGSSNAIIDTGASLVSLPSQAFTQVIEELSQTVPQAAKLLAPFIGDINKVTQAQSQGIAMSELNLALWPALEFHFEGAADGRVSLNCPAECYWQLNSPAPGRAVFKLMGQLAGWPAQSILGLPLLNPYFVLFQRDSGEFGTVRFAAHRQKS